MDAAALISELEPTMATLVDRHLDAADEWFPHELVPWGRGRDFDPGEAWDPNEVDLPEGVRSALFVNLLTEDNLPYYFRTLEATFGRDSAWGEWSRRWTAEEGRHSIVLRDYIAVTRTVDPVELERARMAQVGRGEVPEPELPHDAIAYVALQELATRIAHRNTGTLLEDPAGHDIMRRVAADENRHHLLYRDLVATALDLDPSAMVQAISRQVIGFQMPGTGIVDFDRHARAIAAVGIYDLEIHHDRILAPVVLRHWAIPERTGLDDDGERARDALLRHLERVERAGRRLARRRNERAAAAVA